RSVNPDRRARAADSLGELGSQAAPAVRSLVAALSDPESAVQKVALTALARIGPDAHDAVPDLVRLLKGDNSELHEGVIAALAAIGQDADDAAPALLRIVEGQDASLATQAGLALARVVEPESDLLRPAIPVLVKSLKSDDAEVRSQAVAGLGAAGRIALPA